MGCIDCDDELEHCHGVLVRHADGRRECLECPEDEPAHGWAVACTELGCPCGGDDEVEALPVAA